MQRPAWIPASVGIFHTDLGTANLSSRRSLHRSQTDAGSMVEPPFKPSALRFVVSSPILRVCRGDIILDPDLGFGPGVG